MVGFFSIFTSLKAAIPLMAPFHLDPMLAEQLTARMVGTNVTVVEGDATDLPFPDDHFSGAVSFTMLHHVPTAELQDKLLSEVRRVVKPGGTFVGVDSLDSEDFRKLHVDGGLPFLEIYVNTPISTCEQRDPKGLYKKARAGELKNFTGIDDPYEEPLQPELSIDATAVSPQEAAILLIKLLQDRGLVRL